MTVYVLELLEFAGDKLHNSKLVNVYADLQTAIDAKRKLVRQVENWQIPRFAVVAGTDMTMSVTLRLDLERKVIRIRRMNVLTEIGF